MSLIRLILLAIPLGAAVQLATVAVVRLTERGAPALAAAVRGAVAGASAIVALACLAFVVLILDWFADDTAVGDCAQLSEKGVTSLGIALALALTTTAVFSGWTGHRSLQGERCGVTLAWEIGLGFVAFLMFAWLVGGTSC